MADFIDRKQLIEDLNKFAPEHYSALVNKIITLQPTADVEEVKHSEWILHKDGSGTCKQCRFTQKNIWDYDNWQNFCGHCGAKMDGKGDSE